MNNDPTSQWVDRQRNDRRQQDEQFTNRNYSAARHLGNYNVQESWRGSRDDADARLAYHDYIYRDSRREAAQERERGDRRLALQQEDQRRRELWDRVQKQEKKERREKRRMTMRY